ncbi:hypothetical protein [Sphingomicrobium sediminis]|uniref:Uncharacterized protein n=1 Tax=Sphingomicrobium sediminis TaxID=2950949 RepID=A0A9X2J4M1_9SPHN|nr:hypothetical protein [Sphingomicrobium sediminis]MCM8557352.1 hypothetical protein [Sphingomicrobium sediminis]
METTARLAFTDFLRSLRDAYRVTFAGECAAAAKRREELELFAMTFAAGFIATSLFIA